ncbi:MAG TPA: hypothetical protein VGQ81_01690, partial [Acidobacteriota bacterium]|nr:hypothetical protein [Acidobacteriota bacterium]
CDLCASVVKESMKITTEAQRSQRLHGENYRFTVVVRRSILSSIQHSAFRNPQSAIRNPQFFRALSPTSR